MKGLCSRPARANTAIALLVALAAGCGPESVGRGSPAPSDATAVPVADTYTGAGLRLGEPIAVAVDFDGRVLIADGSPGRIVRWRRSDRGEDEFQRPTSAGFYPTDVAVSGFFAYAVDEAARTVLRFDDRGAYRDILLNFETSATGRRVTPYGIAVDSGGRVAITDVENHQVLLYDAYLSLELAFGNYGSFEGQLSSPRGVSFSPRGEIVVADTGNRRVQIFSAGGAFLRAVPAAGNDNPLRRPRRALVDEDGRVIVADPAAGAVFVFGADGTAERAIVPEDAAAFEPTDVERTRAGALVITDGATRSVLVLEGI
jgi:sugar lactone lactonase YvrE